MTTPQAYIESALIQLHQPSALPPQPTTEDDLVTTIFRLLTSKKFRKYALTDAYAAHIRVAIRENVRNQQPINLTFLGGSYKLWRLAEAPESDWTELFACMYFTRWTAPVCAIYQPGVWFDFFLDDVIVPKINNIPETSVAAYRDSRQRILDFVKAYQPDNLRMTLRRRQPVSVQGRIRSKAGGGHYKACRGIARRTA